MMNLLVILFVIKFIAQIDISNFIAYTKKYLQPDWLRGVQYLPYLYSVSIFVLFDYVRKKIQHSNSVAEK